MVDKKEDGLFRVIEKDYGEILLTDDLLWLRSRIARFVQGGIYLLAGEPGIGKTALGLQLAIDLGKQKTNTLYILNEQSKSDLKKRAELITSKWNSEEKEVAFNHIHPVGSEDGIYDIDNLPDFLRHQVLGKAGAYNEYDIKFIVVDSIQGQGLSSGSTKQYKKIYDFCSIAKREGVTTLLIAHVTKRGEIAGPKALQHSVDCILYMKKALVYRPLFVPKNRYGPAVLSPIPLEMDKETSALRLSLHIESASSVARSFMGDIVEIQVAVALPSLGTKGTITAPYLPKKEIEQILNCVSQIPDLDMSDLNYTIQVRIPGEKSYRSSLFGLPLAMALIGAYIQREIPKHYMYIGELDLLRQVRKVPESLIEEMWSAIENGTIKTPLRIFCPKESASLIREGLKDATVVECEKIEDALSKTWPDLFID